jgi:3-hydroxyisobutyrate dehydrogenase-like beta-hydroxyacid dehydrogenase
MVAWVQLVVGVQAARLAGRNGVAAERLLAVMSANGNLTPTMKAMLSGRLKSPPGTDATYDGFLTSQAGIGEKDLALAIGCAAAAGLPTDMLERARDLVRSIMTEDVTR